MKDDALNDSSLRNHSKFLSCWIPLTTHSRAELDRYTPLERHHQLIQVLAEILKDAKINHQDHDLDDGSSRSSSSSNHNSLSDGDLFLKHILRSNDHEWEEKLIHLFRTHDICRRLASLVMRPYFPTQAPKVNSIGSNKKSSSKSTSTTLLLEYPTLPLVQKLAMWWPRLLELPPALLTHQESPMVGSPILTRKNDPNHTQESHFDITMVIPAYRENGTHLSEKLNHALEQCTAPKSIEVLIVDAGESTDDFQGTVRRLAQNNALLLEQQEGSGVHSNDAIVWGDIRLLTFENGGGRGPCLNFGAENAKGTILTFCHLDNFSPTKHALTDIYFGLGLVCSKIGLLTI